MAEGGMWEEADIPRQPKEGELIHFISHTNLLNTFLRLRRFAS